MATHYFPFGDRRGSLCGETSGQHSETPDCPICVRLRDREEAEAELQIALLEMDMDTPAFIRKLKSIKAAPAIWELCREDDEPACFLDLPADERDLWAVRAAVVRDFFRDPPHANYFGVACDVTRQHAMRLIKGRRES